MALSIYNIKKWAKMLSGKSVLHVNQDIGKVFSVSEIRGYYNNMTEKVLMEPALLENEELPKVVAENGSLIDFPVAIFQYGLGAYDLYIQTKDERFIKKFMQCVDWTVSHQDDKGRWNNFFHYCPQTPYGAMAQGEGVSLLVRAFIHTGASEYLEYARKAIDFMLQPISEGGTTKYEGGDAYLMEYTFKGMVLNGSIFAWWGLFDYVRVTDDKNEYNQAKEKTLCTLINVLPKFNGNYWSMYSIDGLIASPFYHNLHIAQMQAMYRITGESIFLEYYNRWKKQQGRILNNVAAFVTKSYQKIVE